MRNQQSSAKFHTRRTAIIAAIAIIVLSLSAARSNAAAFSFLDSVQDFFGFAPVETALLGARPNEAHGATFTNTIAPNTFAASFADCPNQVSIPLMTSPTGVEVTIPVNTTDATGQGIIAAQFTFTYDPAILSPLPADISVLPGTVLPTGAGAPTIIYNAEASGTILVAVFGTFPLSGAGPVVNIKMKVIGVPGSTTPLTLTDFLYNGGLVCTATLNSTLSVNPLITVTQTANGTISPGTTTVAYGTDQTFTITPFAGFGITGLEVDGVPQPIALTYTFTNVTTNHTITATFAACTNQVSLPLLSSPTGVEVTIPVNTTDVTAQGIIAAQFAFSYDPAILSPLPADISVLPGSVLPTGVQAPTIIYNAEAPGTILVAVFGSYPFSGAGPVVNIKMKVIGALGSTTPLTLTDFLYNGGLVCMGSLNGTLSVDPLITVTQTANGTISPGTTTVAYGTDQTFTITPFAGFDITSLEVDGVPQPIAPSYTFTNVTTNHTITATFAACPNQVSTPAMTSQTGVDVIIPVNTADVTSQGIIAAQFRFSYDPAVLSPLPADTSVLPGSVLPTGVEAPTIIYNADTPGTILVAVFGSYPFSGAGTIVNIKMIVIGPIGSTTPLTLTDFLYNGGLLCVELTSGSLSVTATATTVTSSQNPSVYGSPITITATVNPIPTGGTIDFVIDTVPVATGVPVNALGQATYTTSSLNVAGSPHSVTADFSGFAPLYDPSSGSLAGGQVVGLAATTTVVTFEAGPYTYRGTAFTATAEVTGVGSQSFTDTVPVVYTGDCTNVTAPNGCTATATYGGDANHEGSSDAKSITITKADAACTVAGYSVTYDGLPHTATGSCLGVLGETLAGLDLSGTTHTNAGSYLLDPWTFTAPTANYNNTGGTVDDAINARELTGTVTYRLNPGLPVRNTTLTAAGSGVLPVPVVSDPSGNFSMSGFDVVDYIVTPAKTAYLGGINNPNNGVFSDDATKISRYVVGLDSLTDDQIEAGRVSGFPGLTAFDAGLIAQWIVGITNPINQTGQWRFTPPSVMMPATGNSAQNFTALLKGDVNGSWANIPGARPAPVDPADAVRVSVPNTESAQGSIVRVPLTIDNLNGLSLDSYQFDIEYDPAVIEPVGAAASLADPVSGGQSVVSNAPVPGLLKVVVYGAIPVSGDGVYVNLRFSTLGGAGSTSPLNIRGFRLNDGQTPVFATDGVLTVTAANDASIRGRLLTAKGQPVANARVVLTNTTGESFTAVSSLSGQFEFSGLVVGETYTVSVRSQRYLFSARKVGVTANVTELEIIADQ